MNLINNNINDNTIISGKYNTIGDLKKASKRSCSQVITKMENGKIKDYLHKWAFEYHYLPNDIWGEFDIFQGSLTSRIKKINNKMCYNHIIKHCFDSIDPLKSSKMLPILDENCKIIIKTLHTIDSAATGIYMDYLTSRIICELKQEEFVDTRANKKTNLEEMYIDTDNNHYCKLGCKNSIESRFKNKSSKYNKCVFPYCQNLSYAKVKDINIYKTQDVLKELFIVSCCHSEWFGACPSQDNFDQIINILIDINSLQFINPLIKLCKTLIDNSKVVLLNPALGEMTYRIPSDCDLVIDDMLLDIKCTKNNNNNYEILQLLGYSCLLKFNKNYNLRINNICTLNLLKGECIVYNIENLLDSNLKEYLHLIANIYNPNKKLLARTIKPENNSYPLFIDKLK